MTTRARLYFSRFLESDRDWWSDRLRAEQTRRALVVVANPSGLPAGTPPVPVAQVVAAAEADLGPKIPVTILDSGGKATADRIVESLRDGFELLYLVAHGAIRQKDGTTLLYLEKPVGTVDAVDGEMFARRVGQLETRPRLIVLCSCRSAGAGDVGSPADWSMLSALGPRLAAEGVPAVLAMQGNVPDALARPFLHTFFERVMAHGMIDQAVAEARSDAAAALPEQYWMPALFLRLRSGNLRWYAPQFIQGKEFRDWPSILQDIQEARCTPILGPGLLQPLLGSTRELARKWAEDNNFPMARPSDDDLPQVAQFMAMSQQRADWPRNQLRRHVCRELLHLHGAAIDTALKAKYNDKLPVPAGLLDDLLEAAWLARRDRVKVDSYTALASLPFAIYFDANPNDLMRRALTRAVTVAGQSKQPRSDTFNWVEDRQDPDSPFARGQPPYTPSEKEPLVYHLFGDCRHWEGVPVTEDDHFAYLANFGRGADDMPDPVQQALNRTSLMFLGFQLDDWSFRVLLHALKRFQNRLSEDYKNVAVQIDPAEGRIRDAVRARDYMNQYLQAKRTVVFWGSTDDFLEELWGAWTTA